MMAMTMVLTSPSSSAVAATTYSEPSTVTVTGPKVGPLTTRRFRQRPCQAISSSSASKAMTATNTHEGPGRCNVTVIESSQGVEVL